MKRPVSVILTWVLVFVACDTSEKMHATSLRNFGNKYAEAWSSKNPENLASFYAEDGWLRINDGEPAIGQRSIAALVQTFMLAFPDMKVTMDSLVTSDTVTAFHWTLSGTYSKNGNKVQISGVERWIFNAQGYIQQSKGSFDKADYYSQLGEQAE